jgi:hypothetical protein
MFRVDDSDDDNDDDDSDTDVNSYMYEVNLYRAIPTKTDFDKDPLEFWKAIEKTYPILSQLAKQYLGVPASSVTVERLCSTAGDVISFKHSVITPENSNILNCLCC